MCEGIRYSLTFVPRPNRSGDLDDLDMQVRISSPVLCDTYLCIFDSDGDLMLARLGYLVTKVVFFGRHHINLLFATSGILLALAICSLSTTLFGRMLEL